MLRKANNHISWNLNQKSGFSDIGKEMRKKKKKSALNNVSKNSISPYLSQMNSLLKGCKISLSLQQKQSLYGAPFLNISLTQNPNFFERKDNETT